MITRFNINRIKFLNLLVSIIGLLLVGVEIYLNSHNTSICKTEGCTLVHTFDTYGVLNYIGFSIFLYLFLVALLDIFNFFLGFFLRLRTYILALSIIVEGYFLGFQTWYLNAYCHYCLTVAGLLILALFLDYLYPEKPSTLLSIKKEKNTSVYKTSILGFFSIFFATFLVHFSLKPINLDLPVIIYEKGCPHCRKVISYIQKNNIKAKLYSAKEVISLMRILNIHSVPLLIDKKENSIILLKGEDKIKDWFQQEYKIKKEEKAQKNYRRTVKRGVKRLKKRRELQVKKEYIKKQKSQQTPKISIFESSNNVLNTDSISNTNSGSCSIDKPCE